MLDSLFNRFRGETTVETDEQRAHRLALVKGLTYEVIPLKSLDAAVDALPSGSSVSVTASPAKGLAVTQEITENLLAAGHHPIPHMSARLVRSKAHTAELAAEQVAPTHH
jgi:methylenetetrahydrofolate reductase (NADPH)